jgi:hypothetical protein
MKLPKDLTRDQLVVIVGVLHDRLFWDEAEQCFDLNKDVNGGDLVDDMAAIIEAVAPELLPGDADERA